MYRRRRSTRGYERVGKPVIGFYTKGRGKGHKHIPITAHHGRRKGVLPAFKTYSVEKQLLETVVSHVLSQAPMMKEIRASYVLADALYKNWDSISKLYDVYEKEGWEGVTAVIGTDMVRNALSSAEADITWVIVSQFIPKEYHNVGKQVMANIMDKVTNNELEFVKRFLKQTKNSRPANDQFAVGGRTFAKEVLFSKNQKRKRGERWPKEIEYV